MSLLTLSPNNHAQVFAGIVTGWGSLSEGGKQSPSLQEVELNIITDKECSELLGLALGHSWG